MKFFFLQIFFVFEKKISQNFFLQINFLVAKFYFRQKKNFIENFLVVINLF